MSYLICDEPQIGRLDRGLLLRLRKKILPPPRLRDCVGEISVLPRPVITASPPRVISLWDEEQEEKGEEEKGEARLPPGKQNCQGAEK